MASPLVIECPHCGAKLRLKDAAAVGKKVRCRQCEEPFVATPSKAAKARKAADEGDDFAGVGAGGIAPPPPVLRRTKKKKKPAGEESEPAPSADGPPQLPKWFMPAMVGGATLVGILLLVGIGFWVRQSMAGSSGGEIKVPTTWGTYRHPNETFTCGQPSDWEAEGGGQAGSSRSWVRFRSGDAVINLRQSAAGGPLADIAGAFSDPNEEDEELTPVAKLHDFWHDRAAEEFRDYQEQQTTTVRTGMGDARRSEFTAKVGWGSKVRGFRVTYISPKAQLNAICQCPEENWETLKPAFEKFIESVSP